MPSTMSIKAQFARTCAPRRGPSGLSRVVSPPFARRPLVLAALFSAAAVVWPAPPAPAAQPPDRNASTPFERQSETSAAPAPAAIELQPVAGPVKLPMQARDYVDERTAAADEINLRPGPHFVDERGRFSVLVHLDPQADAPAAAGRAAESLPRRDLRDFARNRNIEVRYEYEILPNTINLRGLTQQDIDALAQMPGVARVEMDEIKHIYLHDGVPLIRGLESQKAAAGHSARGAGVRVCIIDTGINASHLMFTGKIDTAAGYDFYNNDSNPADDQGHGSNVAGIAAGLDGFNVNFGTCGAEPFQGVAPDATIIAVKVCSAGGSCPTSAIVAGINHCASASLPGGRADVINMSLGGGQFSGTCNSESSAAAANNAVAAGVTVIAAAGNNGFANALGAPACGSQVIAVGAVYDSNFPNCQDPDTAFTWCLNSFCTSTCTDSAPVNVDERICFSNRSVNLDVAAPGGGIWSAGSTGTSSIIEMFGTSQASPHVAGLAALMLGQDPSLTPAEVRQLLRDGAIDLGATGFDSDFGWGRIDVINTLDLIGGGGGCTTNPECDDGVACNGAETCVAGSCQSGTPIDCNDGIACTTDACNEPTGSCSHTPNHGACNDGLFCNGTESCHATLGCQSGTDPCAPEPCNEGSDTCGASEVVWVVFTGNTSVPGVGTATNEDIVAYDLGSGTWSLVFDGSDVGLSSFAINGMSQLSNGDILLTTTAGGSVGGVSFDDSDIIRFAPTSLGATTAGTFSLYFDGSDVGLTTNDEDLDAISLTSTGDLVVSVIGNFSASGASGVDEDLFRFTATSLGTNTAGTFSMYFDGSDVGLSNSSSEDVDAACLTSSGTILLSTLGNFSVPGVSGANEDLFEFFPTSLGGTTAGTYQMYLDLSTVGISTSADVAAVQLVE